MEEPIDPAGARRRRVLQAKFAAYLGWSQPFVHTLVRGLERHYRTTVLCARRENAERFPVDDLVCVRTATLLFPGSAATLALHLRNSRAPDLLHAHFGWSGVRLLLLQAALGIPWITTFGGRDAGVQLHDDRWRELYRCLLARCDRIVCVSEEIRAGLADAGAPEDRLVVIRRGTDIAHFRFADRSGRSREEPLRLLMVGRLVEKKDHALALRGLVRLRSEGVPAVLRIVGEGPKEASIRALRDAEGLGSAVELLPPTDRKGVAAHMEWADAFVHCSRTGADGDREGIPNALVEGAATGLPVLGTYHGGIPEVVRHGETGLLVPEGDQKALDDALFRLAGRQDERLAMGRAGSEYVRRELDLSVQVDRHRALYEKVIAEPFRARPALPEMLPAMLAAAFGSSAHHSKATLDAARWLDRSLTAGLVQAAPIERRRRSPRPRGFHGALVAAKPVVKRMLGPALPWVSALRRVSYQRWIGRRQTTHERFVWDLLRQGEGLTVATPEPRLVEGLLQERPTEPRS